MDNVKTNAREMIPMTTAARISPKGQITVPVGIRRALGVNEGDSIIFQLHSDRVEVKAFKTPDTILSLVGILQSPVNLPDIGFLSRTLYQHRMHEGKQRTGIWV